MWHDLAGGHRTRGGAALGRPRSVAPRPRPDRPGVLAALGRRGVARDAHLSAGHFSREFRLAYGESPYAYLMTRRIERAMALLRRGDLSVTEVCFEVGCSSLAPSAVASPNLSVCLQAPTGSARQARRRGWRRASPNGSPNRSGIEKRGRRTAPSMTAMDITIHATTSRTMTGRIRCLLPRHARLRGPQRRRIRRDALDHGRPGRPTRHIDRPASAWRGPRHHRRRAPHHRRDDGQGDLRPHQPRHQGPRRHVLATAGKRRGRPGADDQPYGIRDCAVRDPAGNLIRIIELR